jgi:hypothetical protein
MGQNRFRLPDARHLGNEALPQRPPSLAARCAHSETIVKCEVTSSLDNTVERLWHGDRVELNVNSENLLSEPEEIFGSWRR